jgi:hypothetical protein
VEATLVEPSGRCRHRRGRCNEASIAVRGGDDGLAKMGASDAAAKTGEAAGISTTWWVLIAVLAALAIYFLHAPEKGAVEGDGPALISPARP